MTNQERAGSQNRWSCGKIDDESGPVRMRQHPRGPNPLT